MGIWTQGCSKHCRGCISPELQPVTGRETDEKILAEIVREIARKNQCRGLTVSGGDPLEQPEAMLRLLRLLRKDFEDILVYTGFALSELQGGCVGPAGTECLKLIDVLIDGRYMEERNVPNCVLRGSDNQVIHFFNQKQKPVYSDYMKQGRILESFVHGDETIITGILDRGRGT